MEAGAEGVCVCAQGSAALEMCACVCVEGGGVPCSKSNEGNEGLDGCRCEGEVSGVGLAFKEGLEGRMSR